MLVFPFSTQAFRVLTAAHLGMDSGGVKDTGVYFFALFNGVFQCRLKIRVGNVTYKPRRGQVLYFSRPILPLILVQVVGEQMVKAEYNK